VGIGFLLSRLAIHAWMSRVGRKSLQFSANAASILIGTLFVPIALFIYVASRVSWPAIDNRLPYVLLVFALTSLCTAPITFVVVPLFGVYLYGIARGAMISNQSIYSICFLCLVGQAFWLTIFVERME
jgi:hypothetical protein